MAVCKLLAYKNVSCIDSANMVLANNAVGEQGELLLPLQNEPSEEVTSDVDCGICMQHMLVRDPTSTSLETVSDLK